MFAAPFMLFVVYLLELRFDAKLILFKFKRPVGYKAQDIGIQIIHIVHRHLYEKLIISLTKVHGITFVN